MADYPSERKSKLQEIISNYGGRNNPILELVALKNFSLTLNGVLTHGVTRDINSQRRQKL